MSCSGKFMGIKPGDFKADPVFLKTARNMTSLASNNLPNELALAVYSFNNNKKMTRDNELLLDRSRRPKMGRLHAFFSPF